MELIRLQELMATRQAAVIAEGTQHDKDFDGIQNVVDDCLADLKDKLGKGGNLANLFKASGASKLDSVKDDDGKNVLTQIMSLTADYVKKINGLMSEAGILVNQVHEGLAEDGTVLTEAADYSDSSDFTEEFYKMSGQIVDMKGKMKNPRWLKWMQVTDTNFGTECEVPARAAIQAINTLSTQFDDIDAELDKAS